MTILTHRTFLVGPVCSGVTGGVTLAFLYGVYWSSPWANGTELRAVELPYVEGMDTHTRSSSPSKSSKHKHQGHSSRHSAKQNKMDRGDFAVMMLNGEKPSRNKKKSSKKGGRGRKKITPTAE